MADASVFVATAATILGPLILLFVLAVRDFRRRARSSFKDSQRRAGAKPRLLISGGNLRLPAILSLRIGGRLPSHVGNRVRTAASHRFDVILVYPGHAPVARPVEGHGRPPAVGIVAIPAALEPPVYRIHQCLMLSPTFGTSGSLLPAQQHWLALASPAAGLGLENAGERRPQCTQRAFSVRHQRVRSNQSRPIKSVPQPVLSAVARPRPIEVHLPASTDPQARKCSIFPPRGKPPPIVQEIQEREIHSSAQCGVWVRSETPGTPPISMRLGPPIGRFCSRYQREATGPSWRPTWYPPKGIDRSLLDNPALLAGG